MTLPLRLRTNIAIPAALGVWSAAAALAPSEGAKLGIIAAGIVPAAVWWTIAYSYRWLILFFVCLLLTPPLPFPLGNSGIHLAPLFAALGILTGILRIPEWRPLLKPVPAAFVLFWAALLQSIVFAGFYSGWEIAAGSLIRVCLFGISVYVFFYAYAGPALEIFAFRFETLLFWIGAAAALFACIDFYFQFPAPAGFGPQFVWLSEGVFRRAQGLFYEASTLGNFCAFFLVMIAVSLFRPREEAPCSRPALLIAGLIFSAALIFSYSRASIISVAAAVGALAYLRLAYFRRASTRRPLILVAGFLAAAGLLIQFAFPSFSKNYWDRMMASLQYFWQSPNSVLSGRLASWKILIDFLVREPWHALFGIGYKTLPYSDYIGTAVVADNTYLGLLVETGLVGLVSFLILNVAILRSGLKACRSARPRAVFLGEWIFCFWFGQIFQMLSGDLITYWRVLPVYFWVLGAALREAGESS